MYGIEGVHYKVLEEGGASNGQDIITWADGLDASTSNYAKSGTWIMPNQFIAMSGKAAPLTSGTCSVNSTIPPRNRRPSASLTTPSPLPTR